MEQHAWCSKFSVEALASFVDELGGQTFGDIAKAFRAEGVTGEELVPFLGSHEVLTKFLSDCNIKVLPFAAIKLHYKLTRPFAGAVSPRVLQMLVSTCGGKANVQLAELLRVNGVTGPDIAENLSNHKDLADFCSTLNVELSQFRARKLHDRLTQAPSTQLADKLYNSAHKVQASSEAPSRILTTSCVKCENPNSANNQLTDSKKTSTAVVQRQQNSSSHLGAHRPVQSHRKRPGAPPCKLSKIPEHGRYDKASGKWLLDRKKQFVQKRCQHCRMDTRYYCACSPERGTCRIAGCFYTLHQQQEPPPATALAPQKRQMASAASAGCDAGQHGHSHNHDHHHPATVVMQHSVSQQAEDAAAKKRRRSYSPAKGTVSERSFAGRFNGDESSSDAEAPRESDHFLSSNLDELLAADEAALMGLQRRGSLDVSFSLHEDDGLGPSSV